MQEVFKVYSPHNLFSSESLSFNPKQVHNLFLTGFCIRRVEESAFLFAVGSLTCPCPSPMSARSVLSVSPQYHTPACRSPGPMHVSCPWGAHSLPGLRRGHNRAVIQVGWKGWIKTTSWPCVRLKATLLPYMISSFTKTPEKEHYRYLRSTEENTWGLGRLVLGHVPQRQGRAGLELRSVSFQCLCSQPLL